LNGTSDRSKLKAVLSSVPGLYSRSISDADIGGLLISPRPRWVEKALDFDEVAIGVTQETVIDVILGIERRRFLKDDALVTQVSVPFVHLGGGEGQDDADWLFWSFAPLAETEVAVAADTVDAAVPLIECQSQTEYLLIETSSRRQIAGVEERDLLMDKRAERCF
jgi:hypothetical protein